MLKTTRQRELTRPTKTHVRKNDEVVVLTGRDRGKKGKVLRVIPSKASAIVERVNFLKKHTRKNPQKNQQGGILEREAPIRVSKLQIVCPSCSEPTRVGRRVVDGESTRICKQCDAELGR